MSFYVVNPDEIFFDSTGLPRAGGFATFFVNTTTTKANIYSDEALTVAQANPYTLDAYGRIAGDVKFTGLVTMQLTNSDGSDIRTIDNVTTLETANQLRGDLADPADTANGDAQIAVKTTQTNAVATTQHVINETTWVDVVSKYGADNTGVTSPSTAINNALTDLPSSGGTIYLPNGTYELGAKIEATKHGVRIIGESARGVIIRPASGYSDTYLIDLGDGVNSKYDNEIAYCGFDDNGVANITAIRYNRINNPSSIHHCDFDGLNVGILATTLALSNHYWGNRFNDCTKNIHLDGTAGNSTTIGPANYFNGGYVHLDNSMNHDSILSNIFDADSYLVGDGASGQRGLKIAFNRFEVTTNLVAIQLGLVRGATIQSNVLVGNSAADIGITISSSSVLQQIAIKDNSFESYNVSYIQATSTPNGLISLVDNRHDGSASTPYDITNMVETKVVNLANDDDNIIGIKEDTLTLGVGNNVINFTLEKSVTLASAIDLFTITTASGERGSYAAIIEGVIDFAVNSPAVASMSVKYVFSHVNDNGGVATDGAVTEVYETASAADAAGTRDITGNTCAVTTTSNTVSTVDFTVTGTGSGSPIARLHVKVIHNTYSTDPVIALA